MIMDQTKRRFRITTTTYRGDPGFLLRGWETDVRGVRYDLCSIFVTERKTAEAIKARYKAGAGSFDPEIDTLDGDWSVDAKKETPDHE